MKNFSLGTRLLTVGLVTLAVPLLSVFGLISWENNRAESATHDMVTEQADLNFRQLYPIIINTLETTAALLEIDAQKVLGVAQRAVDDLGGIHFSTTDEVITWTAVNQYTKERQELPLPIVHLGDGTAFERVSDFKTSVPVVDQVSKVTGDTATIFQRMNEAGDMLRIATSVSNGGKRAVGTYIPAVNPDGKPNPVVSEILAGRTFYGRAFVVDQWYVTVYQPLLDEHGQVKGILYVGTPEQVATQPILENLAAMEVGETGEVFILNLQGTNRGRYVLGHDSGDSSAYIIEPNGESSVGSFVSEMLTSAYQLNPGEVRQADVIWNTPESGGREITITYGYFAPWDWLVGLKVDAAEFDAQVAQVGEVFEHTTWVLVATVLIALTVATVIFVVLTRSISRPLTGAVFELSSGARETQAACDQVAAASQSLAEGSSEQAASLEETSSSMEEMTSMVTRNAEVAKRTNANAKKAHEAAQRGTASV